MVDLDIDGDRISEDDLESDSESVNSGNLYGQVGQGPHNVQEQSGNIVRVANKKLVSLVEFGENKKGARAIYHHFPYSMWLETQII